MQRRKRKPVYIGQEQVVCHRPKENRTVVVIGAVLVGVGALLLFLCVPGWAWTALLALAFICVGLVLLKIGKNGR